MEEMNTGTRMEATDFDIYDIDMMNLKPIYWYSQRFKYIWE